MFRIQLSPPHGILFVLDPTNLDVVIPEYVTGECTASNETCVSICTQTELDGPVEVTIQVSGVLAPNLSTVFVGSIIASGGAIAVLTSENELVFECDVPIGMIEVTVAVDDESNASRVAISLSSESSSISISE